MKSIIFSNVVSVRGNGTKNKMIVKITIPDFEEKERVLNYFYQMCLDEPSISQNKFKVEIEGTDFKRIKKED